MTSKTDSQGRWVTTGTLRCHAGIVRTTNQDRVGHADGPGGEIYVVADGVGGEAGGAEAATLAVDIFQELAKRPSRSPEASSADTMQQAVQRVNEHIDAERLGRPELRAMASTVAAVYLRGASVTIGHIGDSRVYLSRTGDVRPLTRDHSVVERMVAEGILTAEEAGSHPKAHILTHSLGQQDVVIETTRLAAQAGDVLLLCSDGLWSYVESQALSDTFAQPVADAEALADALLQLALDAGAPDNVSVVIVRLRSFEENQSKPAPQAKAVALSATAPSIGWKRWSLLLALLLVGIAVVLLVTGNPLTR